jgi:hypothetical protein
MLLEEVKEQVFKLPPSDRLALVSAIIASLQEPISKPSTQSLRGRCRWAPEQILTRHTQPIENRSHHLRTI